MKQHARALGAGFKTVLMLFSAFFMASTAFAAELTAKTILVFGDSLTAGHGLPEGKSAAWPAGLETELKTKNPSVRVINAGLSGETSAGGLRRVDWVLKQKADVFVLELGGNDALRGLPVDQLEKNLRAIVAKVRAKNPDAQIVIAGLNIPSGNGPYAESFNAVFPKIARDTGAKLIPNLLDGVFGRPEFLLPDGIHPNAKGHAKIVTTVKPVLEPLVVTTAETPAADSKSAGH